MGFASEDDLAVAGFITQRLRDVPAQEHGGVLSGTASHEDQFELVLVAGPLGGVDGFDHGGVGDDLGSDVADGEVGVGVVASCIGVCEARVRGCGTVAGQGG